MRRHAECKAGGHSFGAPTSIGGGIIRLACAGCGAITMEMHDLDAESEARLNSLFRSSQRHMFFSPLVLYAAVHGEELLKERRFGQAPPQPQRPSHLFGRAPAEGGRRVLAAAS